MSLLDQLVSRGVTSEDLEKAAAVRLFEKAASAEGVNLDELSEGQVSDLFNQFTSNLHPTKEASTMDQEVIDLFEKTAAAEGIDLGEMDDDDLQQLFQHYVENVLPGQVEANKEASAEEIVLDMFQKTAAAEGIDLEEMGEEELEHLYAHYVENVLPDQLDEGGEDDEEKVASAHEKLAEAEILGRHMARAYVDEMNKVGAKFVVDGGKGKPSPQGDEARSKEDFMGKMRRRVTYVDDKAQDLGEAIAGIGSGGAGRGGVKTHRALGYGAPALATAGLAYGGKKLYDRSKRGQEKRSGFSELEVDALLKIAAEGGADAAADAKESLMDKAKRGAKYVDDKAQGLGRSIASVGTGLPEGVSGPRQVRGGVKTHRALGYGAPALATAGLAAAGKKMYDRSKRGQEKQSSAVDYDDVVNEVALRMLADAGYNV
jgi:hypothetical protein